MYRISTDKVEELKLVCDMACDKNCAGDMFWPGFGINVVYCQKHAEEVFEEWDITPIR
jgi:hypothetical protein